MTERAPARVELHFTPTPQEAAIKFVDTIDIDQDAHRLYTGNNWSGPIRRFHLIVNSDSPQDIVLTCMPGLKRISPTRYELTRTNFHPSTDLKLLILEPNKQATASQ